MKKVDLGQTVAILANIGVIVGIAFLALELNQNNRLLRSDAEYNYLEARLATRRQIVFDPDYAEFVSRIEAGNPLSATDRRRAIASSEASYLGKQWEYGQFLDGNLAEDRESLIAQWRAEFHDQADPIKDIDLAAWSNLRGSLRGNYVRFMEENVFAE